MQEILKNKKAITLISLVVTIIVLLILAAITINLLLGQNGIINRAKESGMVMDLAKELELVNLAVGDAKIEVRGDSLTEDALNKSLEDQFGQNGATAQDNLDGTFTVIVTQTGNIYEIEDGGKVSQEGNVNQMAKDENPGVLETDEQGNLVINSIEDLAKFSYNVNKGIDNYAGKTVTLGRNLNFNGAFHSYAKPEQTYSTETDADGKVIGYIESGTGKTLKEYMQTEKGFIPIRIYNGKNILW